MRNIYHQLSQVTLIILFVMMGSSSVFAESTQHKVVIQVSSNDPLTQKIALNNAVNLQKHYGMDNISIEIVAFGPGLGLLTKKSKQATRVESLAIQDITFSACANTMRKITKKRGKKPVLLEGVGTVPAGVARIIELQEQGYSYVRP
jgi:intracellular sulfur oxidation DsrE/DsrF family protein